MNNRPDCAYFLLLGLCGAAFLLTIGGILTYVAFNPGSIDGHPHSALSHIPHFHHHNTHQNVQHHVQPHPHPHNVSAHPHPHNISSSKAAFDSKAKQSLILAIIGPLCLLMGILVTIIVGVMALKYDCDQEPQPNISFLRLRSEMSLNFEPEYKNNYELLRPSSSIEQQGGHFSVNPTDN